MSNVTMDIRLIEHGSSDYLAIVGFREQVLRKPLGLFFSPTELATEFDQLHFAGYLNKQAIACAVLQPLNNNTAKMRQVAISPELQGRGLGRQLVETLESESQLRGITEIKIHARQTAVPFYLKLGYIAESELFDEIGLLHLKMYKLI